jgi:D-amino-acid oxidase
VIGGGVIGLSAAVRLAQGPWSVELWRGAPALASTSAVAAALWYPYFVGPAQRVAIWAAASLRTFRRLASNPATGILLSRGRELVPRDLAPEWRTSLPEFRSHSTATGGCFEFQAPVIEMPIYLAWLEGHAREVGVRFVERRAASLDEGLAEADVVVNAAGLGARELAADTSLYPARGQVVRVQRLPAIEHFALDEHGSRGVSYVVPRSQDCVLGGTNEPGRADLAPDPQATRAILERCTALVSGLAGARIQSIGVGLRPARPEVRLESERAQGGRLLVHAYGHGGAGVTLSWGCADEVAELVADS